MGFSFKLAEAYVDITGRGKLKDELERQKRMVEEHNTATKAKNILTHGALAGRVMNAFQTLSSGTAGTIGRGVAGVAGAGIGAVGAGIGVVGAGVAAGLGAAAASSPLVGGTLSGSLELIMKQFGRAFTPLAMKVSVFLQTINDVMSKIPQSFWEEIWDKLFSALQQVGKVVIEVITEMLKTIDELTSYLPEFARTNWAENFLAGIKMFDDAFKKRSASPILAAGTGGGASFHSIEDFGRQLQVAAINQSTMEAEQLRATLQIEESARRTAFATEKSANNPPAVIK